MGASSGGDDGLRTLGSLQTLIVRMSMVDLARLRDLTVDLMMSQTLRPGEALGEVVRPGMLGRGKA